MPSHERYVCTLSEDTLKKAEEELNETPDRRSRALRRLRKSVQEYPGLTSPSDDAFLLRFLRAKKFDEQRALDTIVNYWRNRNRFPEIFTNLRPSAVRACIERGVVTLLPVKDVESRSVLLYRPGLFYSDTADYTYVDVLRAILMTLELLIADEEAQVHGLVFVIDYKDVGLVHVTNMTPSKAKIVRAVMQDSMPIRWKQAHYVHEPQIISWMLPIIRLAVKKKVMDRSHFHGCTYEGLHSFISKNHLPTCYGGTESFPMKEWVTRFLASEDKFVEMEKYGLVEDTPGMKGEDLAEDALQGMSGTFRRLHDD